MFKFITITSALLAIFFHAGVSAGALAGDTNAPAWTANQLLNLVQQRSVSSFEAGYIMAQYQDGALPIAQMNGRVDVTIEAHVIADLRTPRFSFDTQMVTPAVAQQRNSDSTREHDYWTPDSYVRYHVGGSRAKIEGKESPAHSEFSTIEDHFLYSMLVYPPKSNGCGFDDGSAVSLLRQGLVHKGTESLDGRRCCVVDIVRANGTLRGRAWLDVDRSLAPLRLREFTYDGRSVRDEWHSTGLVQVSGGGQTLWVPMHVDHMTRRKSAWIKNRISADRDSIKVNLTLADSMFRPDFPNRTQLHTVAGNKTYITTVGVASRKRPAAALAPLVPRTGWGWVLWANAVIVVALAILLFVRWRNGPVPQR